MNKYILQTILIGLSLLITVVGSTPAQEVHTDHSIDMDNSAYQDITTIRETMVDNFHLVYTLIDMRARMKDMEDMPPMENTHHLMVQFHAMDGHSMDNARVGFLITAPDDEKQKVMAMGMDGGFGADINFEKIGTYTISVKAVFGETALRDSFKYEIK